MIHLQRVVRKPKGTIIITPEFGLPQVKDTLQCKHCMAHWEVDPGSGKQRGWCYNCAGPTCGKHACTVTCAPWEAQLEAIERKANR